MCTLSYAAAGAGRQVTRFTSKDYHLVGLHAGFGLGVLRPQVKVAVAVYGADLEHATWRLNPTPSRNSRGAIW